MPAPPKPESAMGSTEGNEPTPEVPITKEEKKKDKKRKRKEKKAAKKEAKRNREVPKEEAAEREHSEAYQKNRKELVERIKSCNSIEAVGVWERALQHLQEHPSHIPDFFLLTKKIAELESQWDIPALPASYNLEAVQEPTHP